MLVNSRAELSDCFHQNVLVPAGEENPADIVLADVILDEYEVIHSIYTEEQFKPFIGFIQVFDFYRASEINQCENVPNSIN